MSPTVSVPSTAIDTQFHPFSNGETGDYRFRGPMEADDLLVAASTRLIEQADLPLPLRNRLWSLKSATRRVAVLRSGFGTVVEAMDYATHPADALWLGRLLDAQVYGRHKFPTLPPAITHASESRAVGEFDISQIQMRERRDASSLDELLYRGLVQEVATRMVCNSEAAELRVRSARR